MENPVLYIQNTNIRHIKIITIHDTIAEIDVHVIKTSSAEIISKYTRWFNEKTPINE